MLVFLQPEGVFKSAADKYIKSGEIARVSRPIEFQGKIYREIIFNKKFLGKAGRDINGIVFVEEDGQAVKDTKLTRELMELAYQMELFFDDAYTKNIAKAIASEKEIQKEERDYKYIKLGLEQLKKEEMKGTDTIEYIISKLPGLKKENNRLLQELIDKIQTLSNEDIVFNKNIIDDISYFYKQALLKNLQKIKLINRGRDLYDNMKKEVTQRRRKWKYRALGTRGTGEGLARLEYTLSYYIRILNIYEAVLNFDDQEYLKYLKNMDRTKVEERLKLIR